MKNKIFVEKQEDRDAVILALARNGYTVRQGRGQAKNGKYNHFIEYWREEEVIA